MHGRANVCLLIVLRYDMINMFIAMVFIEVTLLSSPSSSFRQSSNEPSTLGIMIGKPVLPALPAIPKTQEHGGALIRYRSSF